MASREIGGRPVDLGASYLTVSDDDFAAVVERWRTTGLAHPWTDTFTALAPGAEPTLKSGLVRWGTSGGTRSLVLDLAEGLAVERHDVRAVDRVDGGLLVDGSPAAAVVLAMPGPQAVRLLGPGLDHLRDGLTREYDPVLAVVGRWRERTWDHVAPDGRFEGAFVNDDAAVSWVADDGRRRGDDAPVLVAHSTPDLARQHLQTPDAAAPAVLASLAWWLGVGDPVDRLVHRWGLAKPTGERAEPYLLTDDLLGVCGDGWGPTSKVETAWRSGRDLGRELAGRLASR